MAFSRAKKLARPKKTPALQAKWNPACVSWRFWLGALSNKGGWGQRNHEEIEAGATWKTACTDAGLFFFFESVSTPAYGSLRLVQNVRPSIKYFGNLPWESFEGLNKSSPQNKIKISKKRWPERRRSWIFDGKTGQLYWSLNRKWPFTVFFKGDMSWKFCQQVLARAWSCFAMAKEEISSSQTCMITISALKSITDDQMSEMLSLSCTAMDLMTKTVNFLRESPPPFFLLLGVRE